MDNDYPCDNGHYDCATSLNGECSDEKVRDYDVTFSITVTVSAHNEDEAEDEAWRIVNLDDLYVLRVEASW